MGQIHFQDSRFGRLIVDPANRASYLTVGARRMAVIIEFRFPAVRREEE